MSQFREQAKIDGKNIFEEFGDPATYTDGTGSQKNILVITEPIADLAPASYGQSRSQYIHVRQTDIERPAVHDAIEISGEIWDVSVNSGGSGIHRLLCNSDKRGGVR